MSNRKWTPEDKELVRAGYARNTASAAALAAHLGRTPVAIKALAKKLGLTHGRRHWATEDLDYLKENIGLTSDEEICRHLNRTKTALHIACVRKLRRGKLSNIYTARTVADIVGVGDAKTVVYWQKRGFLKGRRLFRQGPNLVWHFDYEDIEACIRKRPWLLDLSRAEDHTYFHSLVLEEYERDPWYTAREAAPLIGFQDEACVIRWARRGLLKSSRRPCGGSAGEWIIRRSAIERFKTEVLPQLIKEHIEKSSRTRRLARLQKGLLVQTATVWDMFCPHCGGLVTIEAYPRLHSSQIIELYKARVNGSCVHHVVLDKDQPDVVAAIHRHNRKGGNCETLREAETNPLRRATPVPVHA